MKNKAILKNSTSRAIKQKS